MGFRCGIVGMPNVGKSTLFNALTSAAAAEVGNYPFCTVEPHMGRVAVPDTELDRVATLAGSAQTVAAQLEIVDIAGLVRGASKGEGLGNQFLGNIREVDAILHMVRCFEDDQVTHVEGGTDPIRDIDLIETELMLADLESLLRQKEGLVKRMRGADKEAGQLMPLAEKLVSALEDGRPARSLALNDEEALLATLFQLLTRKPVLYICNVDEESAAAGNEHTGSVEAMAAAIGAGVVTISAAIEAEIAQLATDEEKAEFLETLGLDEAGLAKLIPAGYQLLDLITFFTAGPKEARAWTVRRGAKAPEAAGVIHTDFERGFIRAETISYDDFVACDGEQGAKDAGKMRVEGGEYVAHDGDVFHFRFNV